MRHDPSAPGRRGKRTSQRVDALRLERLEERALLTTFHVINTADSGIGSLRQAIIDANNTPNFNVIDFAIPTAGVQTISLLAPLPTVTNLVKIDGTTQSGFDTANPRP